MGWRRHVLLPAAVTVGVAVMATVPATRQPAPGAHRLHRALLAGSFPSRSSGWGGFEGRAHWRGAWRGEPGAGGALRPLPLGASQPAWGGTQGLSSAGLSQLPPPSGLRREDPHCKEEVIKRVNCEHSSFLADDHPLRRSRDVSGAGLRCGHPWPSPSPSCPLLHFPQSLAAFGNLSWPLGPCGDASPGLCPLQAQPVPAPCRRGWHVGRARLCPRSGVWLHKTQVPRGLSCASVSPWFGNTGLRPQTGVLWGREGRLQAEPPGLSLPPRQVFLAALGTSSKGPHPPLRVPPGCPRIPSRHALPLLPAGGPLGLRPHATPSTAPAPQSLAPRSPPLPLVAGPSTPPPVPGPQRPWTQLVLSLQLVLGGAWTLGFPGHLHTGCSC